MDDPTDDGRSSIDLAEALLDDLLQLTVELPGLVVRRLVDGSWRADFLQQALLQDI